jgi:hypothetical protein
VETAGALVAMGAFEDARDVLLYLVATQQWESQVGLDLAASQHQQDHNDQYNQPDAGAGSVAPVPAVWPAWECPNEHQDQNDKENGANAHDFSLWCFLTWIGGLGAFWRWETHGDALLARGLFVVAPKRHGTLVIERNCFDNF